MASGGGLVAVLNISDWTLARFDAIQKVARVQVELFVGRSWLRPRLHPWFGLHVLDHLEAGTIDHQASLRTEELQRSAVHLPPRAGFTEVEAGGESRIFED